MILLVLAVIVLSVLLFRLAGRVTLLERTIEALKAADSPALPADEAPSTPILVRQTPAPAPQPAILKTPARIVRRAAQMADVPAESILAPAAASPAPVAPRPADPAPPRSTLTAAGVAGNLENLIGGKLPIWIGGVALILSAFFLVRFSIESGLLGPGIRSIIGALFGLALLGGSEAARRFPATRDDPRIAQVLAGAGIASLYGTLYMAAELYGLIGAGTAFAMMIAITGAALGLSLRHGPPTAIMGLLGGFLAPFVTGIDPHSIVPLLVYLALFTAGLFALAIHRGWMWLALAATGGGLVWPLILMSRAAPEELQWIGLFVIVLAFAATLALPKSGAIRVPLRLAPLVVGLIQLVLLAPQLQFTPLAWGLYGLLAAASLWLAWRDPKLTPGAGAAFCLMLVLLVIAYVNADPENAPLAALGFALLFGAAGHALARRAADGRQWTAIAIGATAAPLILTYALGSDLLGDWARAAIALIAAVACAWLSWRYRNEANPGHSFSLGLAGGAAAAALLGTIALAQILEMLWYAPILLAAAAGLAAWALYTHDRWLARTALIPLPCAALSWGGMLLMSHYLESLFGTVQTRPPLDEIAAFGLLPAALLGLSAWLMRGRRAQPFIHWAAWLVAITLPVALVPSPYHALILALIAAACALPFAARLLPANGAIAPIIASFSAMIAVLMPMAELLARSLAGEQLTYPLIPAILSLLRETGVPAAILAATFWFRPALVGARLRPPVLIAIGVALVAIIYAFAKQPLAIANGAQFLSTGFLERALITQALFAAGWAALAYIPRLKTAGYALIAAAALRFVLFDLLVLSPVIVPQHVGSLPILNLAVFHAGLAALWFRLSASHAEPRASCAMHRAALILVLLTVCAAVRQISHGTLINAFTIHRGENYLYSAALLGLSLAWLGRGIMTGTRGIRLAGLALLTAVTLKVFLVDAAALAGVLRILSFLGLGLALIAIGWAYGRFMKPPMETASETG